MQPLFPGLRFSLFGFPVTIGIDFLFIALLFGYQGRPGPYIVEWVVVVAVSILLHELGHAFMLRRYSIHPEIRLWGLGGLTISGFTLTPGKSIGVSLAGPLVGIPVGIAVMVVRPWLPQSNELLMLTTSDLIFVNLGWAILNLLPIAGLDGGSVLTNALLLALGPGGRTPGQILVAAFSAAIAVYGLVIGFFWLTIIVAFFGFMNPEPYLTLWRTLRGEGGGAGGFAGAGTGWRGGPPRPARLEPVRSEKRDRPAHETAVTALGRDTRRVFGETWLETMGGVAAKPAPVRADEAAVDEAAAPSSGSLDLDELERRPAPLLADVATMIARRDDVSVASRLGSEEDPLTVLGIVARMADAKRIAQLLATLRREDPGSRKAALLKLQVALHSMGRYQDALAAASLGGQEASRQSVVLEARSAARLGDKKRTAAALERARGLGQSRLSEPALADIVRVGQDKRIGELLAQIRSGR